MKKALLVVLIMCCGQLSFSQLKKVAVESIDKTTAKRIKAFAFETYSAKDAEHLPKLTEATATKRTLEAYTYETISKQISIISEKDGTLLKVELGEVLKDEKGDMIFRFKGYYEMTDDIAEIRVYLNPESKFDGIIFKPIWFDKYYKKDEKPVLSKIEMDAAHQSNAHEFADHSFNNCAKNNFLKLTTENATKRLVNSLTDEKLKAFCEKLTKEFGELKEYYLVEVLSDGHRIIYRYKAAFTKSTDFLEFRVYTNTEHKFAGIWCKDKWHDKFFEDNENPDKTVNKD